MLHSALNFSWRFKDQIFQNVLKIQIFENIWFKNVIQRHLMPLSCLIRETFPPSLVEISKNFIFTRWYSVNETLLRSVRFEVSGWGQFQSCGSSLIFLGQNLKIFLKMSHQTGIQATDALKKFFGQCKDGTVRVIQISIENEELVLSNHAEVSHSWEKDYDKFIVPLIQEDQPCYILYRFDTKSTFGYEWLFISWSPDTSPVRQKMLYASTKATLKQEFGTSYIKEELHGTTLSDITLRGYNKYKDAAVTPAPLTMREEELQELKRTSVNTDYGVNSKHQTLTGVAFPITESAQQAIVDMSRGSYDYLQFRIDLEKEKIHLETAENINLMTLPSKVPDDSARYHLYNFKHTHEGDYIESIVFIYSMPGYKCSIKERMLYSSCKNPLTDVITNFGIEITKKLEIDSGSELTEDYLKEEIHPTKNLHRPKFAKPKGPPSRGPKRMTKTQTTNS